MAEEVTPPDGRPAREPLFAEYLDVVRAAQRRERWEVESSEGQQRGGQTHHEQGQTLLPEEPVGRHGRGAITRSPRR